MGMEQRRAPAKAKEWPVVVAEIRIPGVARKAAPVVVLAVAVGKELDGDSCADAIGDGADDPS